MVHIGIIQTFMHLSRTHLCMWNFQKRKEINELIYIFINQIKGFMM